MTRETALLVFVGLAACSQRTTPLREAEQPVRVDDTAIVTPCQSLNDVCPEAQVNCEGDTDNECIAAKAEFFGGYCSAATGNDPCNRNGELTQDYKDYCEVQSCLGYDKEQCLADGRNQCKPQFCNVLDELQDPCGSWTERDKQNACDMSDEQATCIADALKALVEFTEGGTSTCVYPRAMKAVCAGGSITPIALADCEIQECMQLTTFEACANNYVILCSYLP